MMWIAVSLLLCFAVGTSATSAAGVVGAKISPFGKKTWTNQWVVAINGTHEHAQHIAAKHGFALAGQVSEGVYHLHRSCTAEHPCVSHIPSPHHDAKLLSEPKVLWVRQHEKLQRPRRIVPNDPQWSQLWFMHGTHNISVEPVWAQGLMGEGVVVTVVDDGIEHSHPDLKDNYDAAASWDMNGNDADPFPNEADPINSHGTRCCGQIAMALNNNVCGVGIAYKANIGGIRMLDGDVTDSIEARSLSLNPNHIMIYTNSWGPNDDGRTMEGPGPLAAQAFKNGAEKGRNGLGSIYLFANGNGGSYDDCNADGYSNSLYTIAIGAIASDGSSPWYAEQCAATMAVTYSSGSGGQPAISTVDLHHGCTNSHTGTSAASPMAAGILALVLQANPKLSWRDMQHLIALTSDITWPQDSDWHTNAAGLHVNHKFGFGSLNTLKLVTLARTWVSVGQQMVFRTDLIVPSDKKIPLASNRGGALSQFFDVSEQTTGIRHLEHVQVSVDVSAVNRGSLVFELVSPGGTASILLHTRPRDTESDKMQWTFLTVRHWNESPVGRWALYVYSALGSRGSHLNTWQLILRGT